MLLALEDDLRERGKLDLREAFIDGTFAPAKKRGRAIGKTKRGKDTRIMASADAAGFPLARHVASALPHEVTPVEDTLDQTFTNELPSRLIGDKAYDSDKLDARLEADWGIENDRPESKKAA